MKEYFKEKVTLPIDIGSQILFGKFKNKKAVVKSFGKDKNNQPVIISDTGKEIPLLKIRIPSLMKEAINKNSIQWKILNELYISSKQDYIDSEDLSNIFYNKINSKKLSGDILEDLQKQLLKICNIEGSDIEEIFTETSTWDKIFKYLKNNKISDLEINKKSKPVLNKRDLVIYFLQNKKSKSSKDLKNLELILNNDKDSDKIIDWYSDTFKLQKESVVKYKRLFKESYGYHCLLLPITSDYVKSNIKFLQRKIKPEDIFNDDSNEYGLELSPHITVLYGLKNEDDYEKLKDYFKNKPQIKFTIGEISLFESPDKPYDVLKFEIISNDLVKYNSYVRENFDCDITFPDYNPHMTIAYLVKGKGKNYLKFDSDLTEETFRENHLEFNFANGNKSRIQLGR